MIYAVESVETLEIVEAMPGLEAVCPVCEEEVYARCGDLNRWHFAHKNLKECDTWSEGETEWHIGWKKRVSKENAEVTIGSHRADIRLNNGLVIELQNSPIGPKEIMEREYHYKNMIWLFNCIPTSKNFLVFDKENYFTFKWRWAKRSARACDCPVFCDLGADIGIFEIKKMYDNNCGWGYLHSYNEFCEKTGLGVQND